MEEAHLSGRCDNGCILFREPMNPLVYQLLDVRESQGLLKCGGKHGQRKGRWNTFMTVMAGVNLEHKNP